MNSSEKGSHDLVIVSVFSAKIQKYYSRLILVILKHINGKKHLRNNYQIS